MRSDKKNNNTRMNAHLNLAFEASLQFFTPCVSDRCNSFDIVCLYVCVCYHSQG